MRLIVYTLCFNESDIIPYIVDYWKNLQSQVDYFKVVVFDNYSTDNSVELLSKYPWIEIRQFHSDGQNDIIQAQIKNQCWLEAKGKADFVIVQDFDEILWTSTLREELQYMKDNDFNVMATKGWTFCGSEIPSYQEGVYLHQQVKRGYYQRINHMKELEQFFKFMLIDPNKLETMSWSVGNHICNPKPSMKLYESDKSIAFHINKGLSEQYFVDKRKRMGKRLSSTNKQYGMCYEYNFPEEKSRKEYKQYQAESVDISNL